MKNPTSSATVSTVITTVSEVNFTALISITNHLISSAKLLINIKAGSVKHSVLLLRDYSNRTPAMKLVVGILQIF